MGMEFDGASNIATRLREVADRISGKHKDKVFVAKGYTVANLQSDLRGMAAALDHISRIGEAK